MRSDIHRSGQFLLDVINDILDMSKIEAGRMQLEVERFDLDAMFDEVMRLVGPRAFEGRVTIERQIADGLQVGPTSAPSSRWSSTSCRMR